MDLLVTTQWLGRHFAAPELRIIDASYHLGAPERGRAEWEAGHIAGAQFLDIDALSDSPNPLPHMLPSPQKFSDWCSKHGISEDHHILIYDNSPLKSAARTWWMFQCFGAKHVSILDGGLAKWIADGGALEDGPVASQPAIFVAWPNPLLVRDLNQMRNTVRYKDAQILDARAPERFQGRAPEPRPGLRSGHMPGARNLPYMRLFQEDGTWKQGEALRQAFTEIGVDLKLPIVTSCGSGVTAAVLNFGLALLGHKHHALYDGSWAEWGAQSDTEVVTGL